MQAQEKKLLYTPEEYFALEDRAEFKSEYYQGEIFSMAGASLNHNRIVRNLTVALSVAVQQQPYEVFASDVKVSIPESRSYTYPDVLLLREPPQFAEKRNDTVTNPLIIIEVLSESTKDFDRSGKFDLYRMVPSLQEYILVYQDKIQVEQFVKQGAKQWLMQEYDAADEILTFANIPVQLALADIYAKVSFSEHF
jgi:Uma2 family endonuclease